MTLPINNPTLCEVLKDGKPCGDYSAYVYVSAHAKRLICDGCHAAYREASNKNPILEYDAAYELVPARQALVYRMTLLQDQLDKTKDTAEVILRARTERELVKLREMTNLRGATFLSIAATYVVVFGAIFLPKLSSIFVVSGLFVGLFWAHSRALVFIQKRLTDPELETIGKDQAARLKALDVKYSRLGSSIPATSMAPVKIERRE